MNAIRIAQNLEQCRVGPLEVEDLNFSRIIMWANTYNRHNKYPTPPDRTFGIALYQIHQGMAWKDGGVNKYESFAASALHFIRVAEMCDIYLEEHYPCAGYLTAWPKVYPNWMRLLYSISAAQQQIYYQISKTSRGKARFSEKKLIQELGNIVGHLITIIPQELREECFYEASRIMTDELK